MPKLYLYNIKNHKHFATIYGKNKEECEARAEFSFGNDVPYGWTYAPDFDEINGLIFNPDAIEINKPL